MFVSASSRRALLLSAAALMTLSTAPALAENAATPAATAQEPVQTVRVWGTKVSSSSLHVNEDDIAIRQADHLSDLLRTVPGVDIGGTHSTNTRINFRGLDDRDLNVFIDGALQTNYLFHHMGNLLINADILKSADIQLGTNSVTHGGLGGAVRFETKDARELLKPGQTFGGRVMGGYNTNAQISGSLTAYGQITPQLDVLAYVHHVSRGNFKDGDGLKTVGSNGKTNNGLIKVGYDLDAQQRLELSYEAIKDAGDYSQRPDMGLRTQLAIKAGDLTLPTKYDRKSLNLSYALDKGPALRLNATYYTNDLTLWRDERGVRIGAYVGTIHDAASDNQGLNVLARSVIETGAITHTLKYGVEIFDQKLTDRPDLIKGAKPVVEKATQSAVFLEDTIRFDNGFVLRPEIRQNHYKKVQADGKRDSWSKTRFGLAAELPIEENFRLLASYTELFKGPELEEPFVGRASGIRLNPNLKPETGQNTEFGFRYTVPLAAGQVRLGANLFRTTIKDYIALVPFPGTTT
ncbi:MAG: TonB-dependent receptor domain-containing protein, partial [Asticcacaulis sp.]